MASIAETGFKVDKLTGDNYHNWKYSMRMHLIGRDLWEITTEEEKLSETADDEMKKKFRKRANLALASICLSVSSGLQIYVRNAKTAKEAWDLLEKQFMKKTLSEKILYRRKLYSSF